VTRIELALAVSFASTACWQVSAASGEPRPLRRVRSFVVAPVAAANVAPACVATRAAEPLAGQTSPLGGTGREGRPERWPCWPAEAPSGVRLLFADRPPTMDVTDRALHAQPIAARTAQRSGPPKPQPAEGQDLHQRAVPTWNRVGQRLHSGNGQGPGASPGRTSARRRRRRGQRAVDSRSSSRVAARSPLRIAPSMVPVNSGSAYSPAKWRSPTGASSRRESSAEAPGGRPE
jgi:hypothetical protein